MQIGVKLTHNEGASCRVWAPEAQKVELVVEPSSAYELRNEGNGYFSASLPDLREGTLYKFRLDGSDSFPDPASRFQPQGPFGPSEIINPARFQWKDAEWKGIQLKGQVIYEMHIGTFSKEGTWRSAIPYLQELRDIGVTVLEIMPVSEFPGEFNWGYDGVNLFAPTRNYGRPEDFKEFIDAAHSIGLGVILDVVYNHFGPSGNFIGKFTKDFFTHRYENEWGSAINFDGPNCRGVRDFFVWNAAYWIEEYHLDGLRLDATQQIFDSTNPNIMEEIADTCRKAAGERKIIIVAENEPQNTQLIKSKAMGGFGLDAIWNDDLHHTALVALTGRNEAYYTDYYGSAQEFVSAAKWGSLYQGQYYKWQKKSRGTPTFGCPPESFITFLENHDQVANSAKGMRLTQIAKPSELRAMLAYMLLIPSTPMLFQGEEFGSTRPFLYFADHNGELGESIREGRRKFLEQFVSNLSVEIQNEFAPPCAVETFESSKLSDEERRNGKVTKQLYTDLLSLRRTDPTFSEQSGTKLEGAVISKEAFLLRYFGNEGDDRLVIVNLGREIEFSPAPIPLIAPPLGKRWVKKWSSEAPQYGGLGNPEFENEMPLKLVGACTIVLEPG